MDPIKDATSRLGARIAALRQSKRMRQEDVAAAAGVGRATVREIEHGSVTAEIGSYFRVLQVLGALDDLNRVAPLAAQPADGAVRPVMRVRPPRPAAAAPARRVHHAVDKDVVRLDDYPQLKQIGWNRAIREITGDAALALYEANWRFVEPEKLSAREKALLDRLVKTYGNGVLHV